MLYIHTTARERSTLIVSAIDEQEVVMKNTFYISITIILLGLLLQSPRLFAQDEAYGWQLMSQQERMEYRSKMQSMSSAEERERYRLEHHKQMQDRAKQKGISLPDMPGDGMHDRNPNSDMMRDRMNSGGGMGSQGGGRR